MNRANNDRSPNEFSLELRGKINLTNQLTLILIGVALIFGILSFSFKPLFFLSFIGIILGLGVLLLNYLRFYNVSRILTALIPVIFLSLIHAYIVQPGEPLITGLSSGQIAISIIPFLIFDAREKRMLIPVIMIIWCIFFLQERTNEWIQTPMDSSFFYEPIMVTVFNIINISIITFGLIFFLSKNKKVEKENVDLISKLKQQKEKLSNQRDFVLKQNKNIITDNARLKEKLLEGMPKFWESEKQFDLTFNYMQEYVSLLKVENNGSFILKSLNKSQLDRLQSIDPSIKKERLVGMDLISLYKTLFDYSNEKIKEKLSNYQKVVKDKISLEYSRELSLTSNPNSAYYVDTSLNPILDKNGECTHILLISNDITEKLKIENSLKEKEQQLKYLLESSEDMITIHDEDGTYIYYNGPKKYKIRPEDIVGKTPFDLFDQQSAKDIVNAIKESYHSGKSIRIENTLDWNGSKKWFSEYIYPIRDSEGKVKSVAKICRDINNQKKGEQKIKENEVRLSTIYNNSKDSIGLLILGSDENFIFDSVNDCFIKYLKFFDVIITHDEIRGMPIETLWRAYLKMPEDEISRRKKNLEDTRKNKKSRKFIRKRTSSLSGEIVFDSIYSPILDDQNNCNSILVTMHDITDRVNAERALKLSESRLSTIYNSAENQIGLIKVLGKGKYALESMNEQAIDYLKKYNIIEDYEQIKGIDSKYFYKNILKYSKEKIEERIALFDKIAQEKKTFQYEYSNFPLSKEQSFFNVKLTPILDSSGNCVQILYVTTDITESVLTARALQSSKDQLSLIYNNVNIFVGLWRIEDDNTFILESINKTFFDLINSGKDVITEQQLIGLDLVEFYHLVTDYDDEIIKERVASYQKALMHKKTVGYEGRIATPKRAKSATFFSSKLNPIINKNGDCTHILLVSEDITDRIKSAQELQSSKDQLSLIYNNVNVFIGLLRVENDKTFILESINKTFLDLLSTSKNAITEKQVIGIDIVDFYKLTSNYSDEKIEERVASFQQVVMDKKTVGYEGTVTIPKDADSSFSISTKLTPVLNEKGDCTHILFVTEDITERVKAAQALQSSKDRLSLIYNNTKDYMALIRYNGDKNFMMESLNAPFWQWLNEARPKIKKEEVLGKSIENYYQKAYNFDNEYIEGRVNLFMEAAISKKSITFEGSTKSTPKSKTKTYQESTLIPISDANGNVSHILATVRDTTHQKLNELLRKKSKEEIQKQLKQKQLILETTLDGYISADTNANIVDVNAAYCKLTGYSKEELLNMNISDIEDHMSESEIEEVIQNILKNGSNRFETKHKKKNGEYIDIDANLSVLQLGEKKLITAFVRDITNQKQALQLLKQSKVELQKQLQRNQLILETTFDGYILGDIDTNIIDVNDSYCRMMGYSKEELLNMKIHQLHGGKQTLADTKRRAKRILKIGSVRFKTTHYRKDGKAIDFDTNLSILKFNGVPLVVSFYRDITTEKKVQRELEYRSNFEQLLIKISSQFINLPLQNLDQSINHALEQICKFIEFDRAGIVLFSLEKNTGSIKYEWHKQGFEPMIDQYQDVPNNAYAWSIERLKRNKLLIITSLDDLPKEAEKLKNELKSMGINALINVPLFWQDELIGFIGFNALKKQQKLPSDLKILLRFACEMITNVLQRKHGEEILKKSEEQLAMIYNNSKEYIGLIKVENGDRFFIQSLNKATADAIKMILPDMDLPQLIGIELSKFFNKIAGFEGPDLEKRMKDIKQLVQTKKEVQSQGVIPIPFNGNPFFAYDANLIPIINPQGDCQFVLFVAQDATARKIAENELKSRELQLSLIYNNNKDYIGLIKVNSGDKFTIESVNQPVIEFLNKVFAKIGYIDVIGMDTRKLLNEYMKFPEPEIDKRISILKEVVNFKKRITTKNPLTSPIDGGLLVFETNYSPIIENGLCVKVLCVIRDVTENEKAKKDLVLSEKRMSSVFNGTKDLMTIFGINAGKKILLEQVNQTFIDVWKKAGIALNPEELYGKDINYFNRNILRLSEKKTIDRFKLIKLAIKSKKVFHLEEEKYTLNNTKLYMDVTITPILNENGKTEKVLIVARDFTFKKKANERLILKILETEDRERKRISKELHDSLGQNLTTASLNLNYLEKAITQFDDDYKIKFKNGIKYLNNAIDESRNIAHNLMPQSIVDFGFVMTIESLIDVLNETSDTHFVFYNNIGNDRLPPYLELSLFRITQEAINNILKHAEASKVTLQMMKYPNDILLTIEDNGKGFDIEINKGKSFGLNSMKARVNALSGTINIDSSPGRGSSITINIPI